MKHITIYALIGLISSALLSITSSAQPPETFRPNDANREMRQISYRLPFHSRVRTIDVEIVGGRIMFQGDIILGEERTLRGPQLASAGSSDRRWQNGLIPIEVSTTHPRYGDIMKALDIVDRETNISFVKRTAETDYVEFESDDGCASYYGRKGGRQTITIGDCVLGSIIHEILHAAGIFHEQSRSDRNDFVTINWDNIQAGKEHNFKTYEDEDLNGSDIGDYDYGSIMHYGTTFFSKNEKETITPKNSSVRIGQRDGLSAGDLDGIRSMYPVKARPYTPLLRVEKIDTDIVVDQREKPRLETKRRGGVVRP